jgi:hypothetical protein
MVLANDRLAAQTIQPCQEAAYKVLTPSILAIQCSGEVTPVDRTATMQVINNTGKAPTYSQIALNVYSSSSKLWLLLMSPDPHFVLETNATIKYSVVLSYFASGIPKQEASIPIDLTGNFTIAPSPLKSKAATQFQFTSTIGFIGPGGHVLYEITPSDPQKTYPCNLLLENFSEKHVPESGTCYTFVELPSNLLKDLQTIDPRYVGVVDIKLHATTEDLLDSPLIPMALPTSSSMPGVIAAPQKLILSVTPKVDPKSRISPQKAPATQAASQVYLNFSYAGGVGTAPGWVLNGQIAPILGMRKGWTLAPSATADVGGNKVPGQTYTDTIDFGGTGQRVFRIDNVLQFLTVMPTVTYETDKEFNRDNLLGTVDFKLNFGGLYHTQSSKVLRKFYCLSLTDADKAKPPAQCVGLLPNGSGADKITVQLSDIPPPFFGYALDFHIGVEAGGALADTTVKASTGKAQLPLPAYSICRIVPQVHGILQIWKVSLDGNVTGWYLAATENTVLQTKSNTLYLEKLQTWKGLGSVTATFTDSSASHFGVTVTYKDGFAPPTYARVNSVQAGLLLKY